MIYLKRYCLLCLWGLTPLVFFAGIVFLVPLVCIKYMATGRMPRHPHEFFGDYISLLFRIEARIR